MPFFEGCSPSPLAPSYTSVAAVNVPSAEDVGAASASVKRCSSKGMGGRGGGGGSGGGSLEWLGSNSSIFQGEATWQQFRADLLKRFEPINSTYIAREKLHHHRQYGSVAQYTQQMEELYNRIPDITEGEKVQSYIAGLKNDIRRQVAAANCSSYSEIVSVAERFDLVNAGT
ncbi:unnamed protein product [Closterium sp. NIES-53]